MTAIGLHGNSVLPREIPKINGSSGAFVAIVVILSVIIIVACSAATYLLYESRREDVQPRQGYQVATSRGIEGGSPAAHAPSGGLRSTVDRFLSRHEKKNSAQIGVQVPRGGGQGWLQAAGSDYEESREDTQPKRRFGHAVQMSEILEISSTPSTVPPSRAPSPASRQRHIEADRERLSSMLSDTSMSTGHGSLMRYPDPYAPQPQRSISNDTSYISHTFYTSPSSSPPPVTHRQTASSPELMSSDDERNANDGNRIYPSAQGRIFATQSGTSMRTFDGGSKFIEAL